MAEKPCICAKDDLLEEYIDAMQDLVTIREDWRRTAEEAFVKLSKARVLLGCTALEFDQLRRIDSDAEKSAAIFDVEEDGAKIVASVDKNFAKSFLSRRVGVLPPLCLKESHSAFNRLIEIAANLATTQAQLQRAASKYSTAICCHDHSEVLNSKTNLSSDEAEQ